MVAALDADPFLAVMVFTLGTVMPHEMIFRRQSATNVVVASSGTITARNCNNKSRNEEQ